MLKPELLELLSAEGLRLLDSLPPYESTGDVLQSVAGLRKAGHSPVLVSAVLTQARLRAKGAAKFGEFASRMLFTEAGLEQATRLSVAAVHAGRYVGAGFSRVADLGCGIGADALAMAGIDLEVTGVELDEVTAAIAAYNLAPFGGAWVENVDATGYDLEGQEAVFLDPARRTAGHTDTRRVALADYSPSLAFAFDLAHRLPTGIKLGPGFDREEIPAAAEAQWVSVDGETVEVGLWFGALARPGIRRAALVIERGQRAELVSANDSDDEPTGPLGRYLHEPAGAVIRARLIGDLARSTDSRMLSAGLAYLTGDEPVLTPFATSFRVEEVLPLDERILRQALRARSIGRLEIKKRGVDIDPAAFRKKLTLKGSESGTLVLTRIAGKRAAILVSRLPAAA